jgi:hypothetical protein
LVCIPAPTENEGLNVCARMGEIAQTSAQSGKDRMNDLAARRGSLRTIADNSSAIGIDMALLEVE